MDFMQRVIDGSMDLWRACAGERFLEEMALGTLDKGKFLDYIVQDSIYLRDYLKVFAYAITKARSLRDMQLYYGLLGYVNDGENVTRLNYLRDLGITDQEVDRAQKRPQCRDYCDFLIGTAREGDEADILMAMLPCMLGYNYVFEDVKKRAPQALTGYFGPLVKDYTSEEYRSCCRQWRDIAQQKCGALDQKRQSRLSEIFRQASLHELNFWRMAGEDK